MNDPKTQPQTPPSDPPGPAPSEPPSWFVEYTSKLSADLDRRFEGFKRKYVGDGAEPAPAAPPKSITNEDLSAARRFERVAAQLPAEARERLDAMADQRGFQDAALFAELLAQSLPARAEQSQAGAQLAPRGGAPSSAPSNPREPKSWAELMKLKSEDPKRYSELMDPDHPFDPQALPRFTR